MDFIVNNWYLIIATLAMISVGFFIFYKFYRLPSEKQLEQVREWLLYAVVQAEKELGSGTGEIKLRQVYDVFLTRFAWIAQLITFEMFSYLVDEALVEMREMLDTNMNILALVENS